MLLYLFFIDYTTFPMDSVVIFIDYGDGTLVIATDRNQEVATLEDCVKFLLF